MTKDEIMALEAGRELDVLVAETMGWVWLRFKPSHKKDVGFVRKPYPPDSWEAAHKSRANGDEPLSRLWDYNMPHYSTGVAAAWGVVEKLTPLKFGFNLAIESPPGPQGDWEALFYNGASHNFYAYADTVPLAICRAALSISEEKR